MVHDAVDLICREEYSRHMWSELEELIKAYADTSANHAVVLNIMNNCRPSSSLTEDTGGAHSNSLRKRKSTTDSKHEHSSQPTTPTSELM